MIAWRGGIYIALLEIRTLNKTTCMIGMIAGFCGRICICMDWRGGYVCVCGDFCAERYLRYGYGWVCTFMYEGSSARSASLTHRGMTSFGVRGWV